MSKRAIFDKKNILVTGGAGFIGSHLCDELVKNAKVICVDDFSTGDERNIDHLLANPNFEFIRHDINEQLDLETLPDLEKFRIRFQGIQEIYHLACPTSPKDFEENKLNTLLANSYGIKNILDLAVKHKAKFLQASSSVVYGPKREDNQKIHESDPGIVDPISERSCYDEGKRFSEAMSVNYQEIYGIEVKIARIFRTYGPRMKLNEGHMLPDFITQALKNEDLIIYGDEQFTSSLCFVSDIVDGLIKFMDAEIKGVINFGSDIELALAEVAKMIIKDLDSQSKITYSDKILFMTPLCLPNIEKARNELGWIPVVTLSKGIERTIDDLRASTGLLGVTNNRE